MIAAVDVETLGLNTQKFVLGCIITEMHTKPMFFATKEALWERLLDIAHKEKRRKRSLTIYSHNAAYDFYAYAPFTSTHMKYFSQNPFIAAYVEDGHELIKFLDTMSLYSKMPLKDVGRLIGIEKLETPQELKDGQVPLDLEQVKVYLERDTEICLQAVLKLKKLLKSHGVTVKRLYTIHQIAINYLINQWRKLPCNDFLFWNAKAGELRRTRFADRIQVAYKGGRTEAFKTGVFQNATYVDCNSLYPFAAAQMDCPDLKTERIIINRNDRQIPLDRIGIAKALLLNESDDLGLLPVHTAFGAYYPKSGTHLIGVWTLLELKQALSNGYKLINWEWAVVYEKAPYNPFKVIMEHLYELRFKSGSEFDRQFYKAMMNSAFGKLAQRRLNQEIVIDSVAKAEEYLKENYKILHGVGLSYMYKKEPTEQKPKKYYAPILPTLINAWARAYMHRLMQKLPSGSIIYTDTDSVIFEGTDLDVFNISHKMGDFKLVGTGRMSINSRKSYMFNDKVSVSGITRHNQTPEAFEKGEMVRKRMVTMKTASDLSKIGTFEDETISLIEQKETHDKVRKMLRNETVLVDMKLENINYFIPDLKNL